MFSIDAVGSSYKNYLITKYLPLCELQSTLIELVHVPSGARIMHIANDDPENLFCLSFQTLPYNSNGIAHILEHTVLCGSKKFPVKDPFFAMTRRSLNTYMNALTGQDFTCYPASSQIEKDFYNLLEVYMDAVFHPELKYLSFLQEGHHLEFRGLNLEIQGVVYNEMKGAMSSIDSRMWEALSKRLTPDLPYSHNSGGSPKEIPNLTYQELIDFHREFYHPSRCLFFFYGNLPLAKHLDFLEEELEKTKKIPLVSPLPEQPRFQEPVIAADSFPVTEGEELKSQVVFAWLTAKASSRKEVMALELIESILSDTDASPLTLALLKSGLCTQVESALDVEMSEVPMIIVCKGVETKNGDKLKKILFDTLEKVSFSSEEIESSLHQLEFDRTEIGGEGGPFGLTLFMRSALIKQHGSEPESALLIHSLFSDLRNSVKDPNYLPNLVRKHLLDNPHFVQLTMSPDPSLAKKELHEEQERIKEIQKHLTEEDEKKIRKEAEKLKEYQEAVEHQSIDCLPKVTLKDVPIHLRDFPLIEKGSIFHHSCFTNHILYADLIFDLPELSVEELPLVSFLAHILPELGSGGRSYEENLAYQQRYIGSFDANLSLYVQHKNPDECKPTFSLRGKALYQNAEHLFRLFRDSVINLDLDDKERIEEWLSQHATELKDRFNRAAMHYATQTALENLSLPSFVYEKWHGMTYYQSVLDWEKSFGDAFLERLKNLRDKILGLENHHLVLTCDENFYEELQKGSLLKLDLPNKPYKNWQGAHTLTAPKPQARFIASPVAFTALGMRTISFNDPQAPMLFIATELMKNIILHKEIREKGGAYGSGANYAPTTGNFHFYSYRDPNLQSSVDTFYKAIASFGNFNERELEEAKLGVLQTLDAPITPGNRAIVAYSWHRTGRTKQLREAFRTQVINATRQEVMEAVSTHLANKTGTLVSFLGKELYEKESKQLKTPLFIIS